MNYNGNHTIPEQLLMKHFFRLHPPVLLANPFSSRCQVLGHKGNFCLLAIYLQIKLLSLSACIVSELSIFIKQN